MRYLNLGYFPSPFTVFEEIYKIRPGQTLLFNKAGMKAHHHFKPNFNSNKSSLTDNKKCFEKLFDKSIIQRLDSDKNVGFLISGGFDSCSVLAVASKFLKDINSYSVIFEGDYNEEKYQQIVADVYSTNHNTIEFKEKDVLKLNSAISYMNEPLGDSQFLPQFIISKLVSKNEKVLFSGDGADELFSGYEYYKFYLNASKFSFQKLLYNTGVTNGHFPSSVINTLNQYRLGLSPLRTAMFIDFKLFLSEYSLPVIDNSTMAYSFEVRSPYLDRNIIDFSFKLKDNQLIHNNVQKYILKKTFQKTLPLEIIRRRKMGFGFGLDYANELTNEEDIQMFFNDLEINKAVVNKIITSARNQIKFQYHLSTLILWYKSLKKFIK